MSTETSKQTKTPEPQLDTQTRMFLLLDEIAVRLGRIEKKLDLPTWTESLVLTVPASTSVGKEVYTERIARAGGRITQLVLFFPAGTQGSTAVFVTIEERQVFPTTDGDSVALDNIAQPYDVDIKVNRGDRLRLNGNNTDSVSHTIRLQYTIRASQASGLSH